VDREVFGTADRVGDLGAVGRGFEQEGAEEAEFLVNIFSVSSAPSRGLLFFFVTSRVSCSNLLRTGDASHRGYSPQLVTRNSQLAIRLSQIDSGSCCDSCSSVRL